MRMVHPCWHVRDWCRDSGFCISSFVETRWNFAGRGEGHAQERPGASIYVVGRRWGALRPFAGFRCPFDCWGWDWEALRSWGILQLSGGWCFGLGAWTATWIWPCHRWVWEHHPLFSGPSSCCTPGSWHLWWSLCMDWNSCLWATKFLLCSRRAGRACNKDSSPQEGSCKEGIENYNHCPGGTVECHDCPDEDVVAAVRGPQTVPVGWCCKRCWRTRWSSYDCEDPSIVQWFASWYAAEASYDFGGPSSKDQRRRALACGCGRGGSGFFVGFALRAKHDGCHQPAKHRTDAVGGSSGWGRSLGRIGKQQQRAFNEYKGRSSKRADAGRARWKNFQLFHAAAAAIVQADAPHQGLSSQPGRAQLKRDIDVLLHGAVWRVQGQQGSGVDPVDLVACNGLRRCQRLRWHQGIPCFVRGSSGAKCFGRQLGTGINPVPCRRSPSADLCRSDELHGCDWKALCATHPSNVGCNKPGLHQGVGGSQQQEGRAQEAHKSRQPQDRGSFWPSQSQEESQVSKETESGRCPEGRELTDENMGMEFKPLQSEGEASHYEPGNVRHDCSFKPSSLSHARQTFDEAKALQEMSYPRWCALLTANVLKSRTPFASFLAFTISLRRRSSCRGPSTPAFFPVPVPIGEHFDRMPKGCSSSSRHAIHLKRTIHCVAMALNYWHFGGGSLSEQHLWREPNAEHRALYARIGALIKSDGLAENFMISKSGRKAPELIARLSELSTLLTARGIGNTTYEKSFAGVEIPKDKTQAPEVNPFTDLNADRLHLYGAGHWDVTSFLDDDLKMLYRDPDCLLADLPLGDRPAIRDSAEEVAKLARLWDVNGLLLLHDKPCLQGSLVKVFNSYKSVSQDRQIGDRRGRNSLECRVLGPSRNLPSGSDVMDLCIPVKTHKAVVTISDRRDYYHQIWCTYKRALSNTLGPGIPVDLVKDTKAYGTFLLDQATKRRKHLREHYGDALGHDVSQRHLEELPSGCLWPAFRSVLQGDHAGVEIATSAHASLLSHFGLLSDDSRLIASRCLESDSLLQGLVIDDFFAVSVEKKDTPNERSRARACYDRAQEAYSSFQLLGSPAKDCLGENEGKVVGAMINSGEAALSRGLCTVGAPAAKRIGLSFITLALCQLQFTTDTLHLCLVGGWVAVLTFRRPLMSILRHAFHLVNQASVDPNKVRVVALPRRVANELVLLAVLAPLALSDLGAEYMDKIFCTDASLNKGAICSAKVGREVCQALWRCCRSKGSYSRLLSPSEAVLKRAGLLDEERLVQKQEEPRVSRPIASNYEFIEVFAGAAEITKVMASLGVVVGPPIDLSISEEHNLAFLHVLEWLSCLVADGRVSAFHLSPPCTTFSIMRRPRLRSAACPFGFDTSDPQTAMGTLLSCRSLQLLYIGATNGAFGIMEIPYSAYTKHLPQWKTVRRLGACSFVRTDSCMYGSIHKKSFGFLCVNVLCRHLDLKCDRTHSHVKVEGSYTKGSATYVPKLAEALGITFKDALDGLKADLSFAAETRVDGLENQLVNEVACSSSWKVESAWDFKKQSHINLLEESCVLRLLQDLAKLRVPLRVVNLVDSFVVRGATSKGRSSSLGLSTVLRKVSSMQVAAALYLTLPFVPTRLNPSDDPTREVELRSALDGLELEKWDTASIYKLARLPPTRRWASNWVRLLIRIFGQDCLCWSDRSIFRQSLNAQERNRAWPLDFGACLGFPGEGPGFLCSFLAIFFWIPLCIRTPGVDFRWDLGCGPSVLAVSLLWVWVQLDFPLGCSCCFVAR